MSRSKKIVLSVLCKNESEFIKPCLERLLHFSDLPIYVFDDNSTDQTFEVVFQFIKSREGDKQVVLNPLPDYPNNFAKKRNYIHSELKDKGFDYICHIDVDEQFDPYFLVYLQELIDKYTGKFRAWKFPRVNLPHGKDYPDFQVRLMELSNDVVWSKPVHEIPYLLHGNKNERVNLHDYIGTLPLVTYPILHLPRESEKQREWWS